MKFCETKPFGFLYRNLSKQDLNQTSGLSYLESQGYFYTPNLKEADFFISINGHIKPHFVLKRTVLMITEPESRYSKMYDERYKKIFGGFLGLSRSNSISEKEFYLVPQDFTFVQEFNKEPEYMLALIHQRYKKKYRNLDGDIEREKAVNFFDEVLGENFHTYGRVWQKTHPWNNLGWKGVIKGNIMGKEKLVKLKNYKFVLCFENSRVNGYVSEKIFSGLFSGAVPVYFGAPDIAHYIPKGCYLEFTDGNYDAIYERIIHMTQQEFQQIRNNISHFFLSNECEKFTSIYLAKKLEAHFVRLKTVANFPYSLTELWTKINLFLEKVVH